MLLIFNLQLETAKAFVIALEGELKVSEQNKESYSFHDITEVPQNSNFKKMQQQPGRSITPDFNRGHVL